MPSPILCVGQACQEEFSESGVDVDASYQVPDWCLTDTTLIYYAAAGQQARIYQGMGSNVLWVCLAPQFRYGLHVLKVVTKSKCGVRITLTSL